MENIFRLDSFLHPIACKAELLLIDSLHSLPKLRGRLSDPWNMFKNIFLTYQTFPIEINYTDN